MRVDEGSDARKRRGITGHYAPESVFRSSLNQHRHIVANRISAEQEVGLIDHLFDPNTAEGGKLSRQMIHDLGDALVLL